MARQRRSHIKRRDFARLLGVVGIAGIAGCSGNSTETTNPSSGANENGSTTQGANENGSTTQGANENGSTTQRSTDTAEPDRVDRVFHFVGDMVPTEMQFNPYNPNNFSKRAAAILYDPLAKFRTSDVTFVPYLAEDWSIDPGEMTVSLRSGQTWHDGTAVTAADLAAKLSTEMFLGQNISNYVGSVKATDDTTVRLTLPESVNNRVLKHTVLKKRLDFPRHKFDSEIKTAEQASSDAEKKEARKAILQKKLDEAVGNSAFKLSNTSSQQFRADLYEDHPNADQINFTGFVGRFLPGQSTWQALKQGKLDGIPKGFIPDEVTSTFSDSIVQKRFRGNTGYGLFFQHDDPVWGNLAVRRAIAHVIERPKVAKNSGGSLKSPVEMPTGIPGASVDRTIGDAVDDYTPYETDHDKAASLLKDTGFTKEGGTWNIPNGDTMTAPITTPAQFPDYMKASQTIVSQLKAFGIEAEVDSTEVTTFFGSVYSDGDFKLASYFWGGSNPYPYFGLNDVLGGDKPFNFPDEVDVPSEVGNPDSSTTTVDLPSKVAAISKSSESDAKELIRELTWAFNQTLPCVPIQEKYQQTFMTTDHWDVPDKDSPSMAIRWPVYWLWRAGKLKALPN